MKTTVALILAACVFASAMSSAEAQTPEPSQRFGAPKQDDGFNAKAVKPLMRQKLDRAKSILEGLTLEQYDKIASNARSLKLLSTEAGWKVLQTKEYEQQSNDFRRACDLLEKAAKEKDINRAALSYVSLTVRCVECHNYMREHEVDLVKASRSSSTIHVGARNDEARYDELGRISPPKRLAR